MTSVTIGHRVANIESDAFLGCNALTAVYFEGNAPVPGDEVFEGTAAIIFYRPGTSGWGPTFGARPTLPWSVVRGDVDGDGDVDRDDLAAITAARNTSTLGPEDTRDLDGDGMITVLDARILVTFFAVPGGFTRVEPVPQGIALEWSAGSAAVRLQGTSDLRSGLWEDVGKLQSSTNAVVGNTAERMFFRLVLPE